ncbi:MAG: hypothetical protein HXX18_07635 [Bacteroidetes bacterium]|nr:hypothetical protein [Bacteroidota bacterium]
MKIDKKKLGLFALLINVFLLWSCSKDDNASLPLLKLKTDVNYTVNGSYLSNHQVKLGIIASGKDANITNLVIKCSGKNFTKTIVDEGCNTDLLQIDKIFTNVWGDSLQWTISVMDHNRNFATLNLITYDTTKAYAPINSYTNIEMGMQNNTTLPQLLNTVNGTLYTLTQGQQSPQLVDVLCYYYVTSGTPSYTFSSAGDSDAPTYYSIISSFNPKNYTDWDYATQITTLAFDNCNNDSLLIASFHSGAGFSSRKYKFADVGKVVPFKTAAGKTGLIKVISVSGNESGKIVFDLKIQQ